MPWYCAAFVRAIEIESWAFLIPGGLVGRVRQAFGSRTATVAATASLIERLLLVSLAAVVVGHYVASGTLTAIAGWRFTGRLGHEDVATVVAALLIGFVWIRARQGLDFASDTVARAVWIGVAILAAVIGSAVFAGPGAGTAPMPLFSRPPPGALSWFVGVFLLLPAIGGGDALARAAHDLPPPRVQALRRTSILILLFIIGTAASVYAFGRLVPPDEQRLWMQAPLAGLAQHLPAPAWLRGVLTLSLVAAAAVLLVPAARSALDDAGLLLQRLSAEGPLADSLAVLHFGFGTPARAINATAAAAIFVMVVSGGQVSWLARAYAMVIVVTLIFKIASLMRLRVMRQGSRRSRCR